MSVALIRPCDGFTSLVTGVIIDASLARRAAVTIL